MEPTISIHNPKCGDCGETLKDIFGSDTIDPELWGELDEIDEGQRINVPLCVLDLKRIRQFIKENEDE